MNIFFNCRIEMYTGKRTDLHAAKGTTSIFAWWFFISSSIVTGPRFWHIFQVICARQFDMIIDG